MPASSASAPSPCSATPTTAPSTSARATPPCTCRATAPTDTYLRVDLLVDAARRAGADAVHPGYGFLAESAAFAQAVIDAGLTWIGPPPDGDRRDGLEDRGQGADARRPACRCCPTRPSRAPTTSPPIGFPLLVKASAGGGGRGMRIVRAPAELDDALGGGRRARPPRRSATARCSASATSSAAATSRSRCSATRHGTVVALLERECSIQRRHQKIVEESPSPAVDDDLRRRMSAAAVAAAPGGRLRRRRHRRVPARPRRRVLVPRDEHPPPGRAPGHRGGHRARPRRAQLRDRRRRNRRRGAAVGHRSAATPSRSASPPRTPPPATARPPARSPGSTGRRRRRPRRHRHRDRARRCRRTTTRWSPRSSPTAPTRAERHPPARPPGSQAASLHGPVTNRDQLLNVLAPPGVRRRPTCTPGSSTSSRAPTRSAATFRSPQPPRRWPSRPPTGPRPQRAGRRSRRAGATTPPSTRSLELALDDAPIRVTLPPRPRRPPRPSTASRSAPLVVRADARHRRARRSAGCAGRSGVGRYGDRRFVDADDGHVTFTVLPRHPDPGRRRAGRLARRADAGHRAARARRAGRRRHRRPAARRRRGDEDGAPGARARRRHRGRRCTSPPASRSTPASSCCRWRTSHDRDRPVRIANCSGFYGDRISAAQGDGRGRADRRAHRRLAGRADDAHPLEGQGPQRRRRLRQRRS